MPDSQPALQVGTDPVGGVRRFRASGEGLPPEVAALGPPVHVPRPWYAEGIFNEQNWPLFLWSCVGLGLVLLLGPFAVLASRPPENNAGLFVTSIVGLLVLFFPLFIRLQQKQPRSGEYLIYRDVLVLAEKGEYTLIPWDAIAEWYTEGNRLVTADGQSFVLCWSVGNLRGIIDRIMASISRRMLPAALEQLRAGGEVTFGPFTVSLTTLAYNAYTVRWDDMTWLAFLPRYGLYQIRTRGRLLPYLFSVHSVPNCCLLMEVIRQASPPHLLVPAGSLWSG